MYSVFKGFPLSLHKIPTKIEGLNEHVNFYILASRRTYSFCCIDVGFSPFLHLFQLIWCLEADKLKNCWSFNRRRKK